MFPLSDSADSKRFPFVTVALIVANAVVFYLQLTTGFDQFVGKYALTPSKVDFSELNTLLPFVTSMFLHGDFFHIISNMWFLKIFGDNIEDHFGPILFLIIYLLTGIAGNLAQFYFMADSSIPMLGASGAVSGILGAYLALYPHSKIKSLVTLFVIITVVEISAFWYLGYWFLLQFISGVGSFGSSPDQGGVAFWAHIGGFVVGFIVGKLAAGRKDKEYLEGEIVG